jgi:hypothetical protein
MLFGDTKKLVERKFNDMGYELTPYIEDEFVDMDSGEIGGYGKSSLNSKMPFNRLAAILREARYAHNILDQDEVWVGRDGLKVELSKMSARYATNILAFLKKNAKYYHNGWATWEFISKYSDHSADDLEELVEERNGEKAAREWIKSQKLYAALELISKNSV